MPPLTGTGDAGTIASLAALIEIGGALLLALGAAAVGRLSGKRKRPVSFVSATVAVIILVGIPVSVAAVAAMPVTAALLAMPLSASGWVMIAIAGGFLLRRATRLGNSGIEGCTKLIALGVTGYMFVWGLTGLAMRPEAVAVAAAPETAGSAMIDIARCFLVAIPFWLLIVALEKKPLESFPLGFMVFVAMTAAILFLPIERGFAASILPANDWLRFPLAGALGMAVWILPMTVLQIFFTSSAVDWKERRVFTLILAMLGALLGLIWTVTRLLF